MGVSLKQEVDVISAIPSKRIYRSIIADYDLPKAICELIDNAVDQWVLNGKLKPLAVRIELNCDQQTIRVSDNACGVEKEKLPFMVGPGRTGNDPTEKIIGIFGVGTKRAVVALSQDIRITTRYKDQETYRLEYDDEWLMSEGWELPLYRVDPIEESTTIIDLHRLIPPFLAASQRAELGKILKAAPRSINNLHTLRTPVGIANARAV